MWREGSPHRQRHVDHGQKAGAVTSRRSSYGEREGSKHLDKGRQKGHVSIRVAMVVFCNKCVHSGRTFKQNVYNRMRPKHEQHVLTRIRVDSRGEGGKMKVKNCCEGTDRGDERSFGNLP